MVAFDQNRNVHRQKEGDKGIICEFGISIELPACALKISDPRLSFKRAAGHGIGNSGQKG